MAVPTFAAYVPNVWSLYYENGAMGEYKVLNIYTSQSIPTQGSKVTVYNPTGASSQQWMLRLDGNGSYRMYSKAGDAHGSTGSYTGYTLNIYTTNDTCTVYPDYANNFSDSVITMYPDPANMNIYRIGLLHHSKYLTSVDSNSSTQLK